MKKASSVTKANAHVDFQRPSEQTPSPASPHCSLCLRDALYPDPLWGLLSPPIPEGAPCYSLSSHSVSLFMNIVWFCSLSSSSDCKFHEEKGKVYFHHCYILGAQQSFQYMIRAQPGFIWWLTESTQSCMNSTSTLRGALATTTGRFKSGSYFSKKDTFRGLKNEAAFLP